MAAETQYTANMYINSFAGGNGNLDGSGANVLTMLQAGGKGTLIKSIILKATGNTSDGMIRIFVYDGVSTTRLLKEIKVYAATQSAQDITFNKRVPLNYKLKAGWYLQATTQNGDPINIIVEGLDFAYYATSVRPESTNYTAVLGLGTQLVNTGNSNLDGVTGSNITILSGTTGYKGFAIESIRIKAQAAITTHGVLRFYLNNGSGTVKLFKEITFEKNPQSATDPTFEKTINFKENLQIPIGYSVIASTSLDGSFAVSLGGMYWTYPA